MKKTSNPKQAYGDTKVGLSSLPMGPIYEMALAMTEGGLKYGKHNYRSMGCKASTYFDAAIGHLVSWWEGSDIDKESGVHHLMKAAACLIVMRDSQLMGNDTDDRPIKYPKGVALRKNPLVQKLKDKYPHPALPYMQIAQSTKDPLEVTQEVFPLINGLPERRCGTDRRANMILLVTMGRRTNYKDRRKT